MKHRITFKIIAIGLLSILLLIPLFWVRSVINERQSYKEQAFSDVSDMWTGSQEFIGPILIQKYSYLVKEKIWNKEKKVYELQQRRVHEEAIIRPNTLNIHGDIQTQTRQRGIYKVPVYTAALNLDGYFSNQAIFDLKTKKSQGFKLGEGKVIVAISDMRGIKGQPHITVNEATYTLKPGTGYKAWNNGIRADIKHLVSDTELHNISFSSALSLKGSRRFDWLPTGQVSQVNLSSNWPHPSFQGRFTPEQHDISDSGFKANWSTSPYSSDTQNLIEDCIKGECHSYNYVMGVNFIQPVDAYTKTERSAKYGLLFIAITFAAFFLFEVIRKIAIHPIQYTMVGLSLALFFLLLISLSEHMLFGLAYSVSALACIALLTIYLSAILRSYARGIGFAIGLTALYGFIYVVISSEDFALLMGACLLFSALAAVMLMTRHVDWYQIAKTELNPTTVTNADEDN